MAHDFDPVFEIVAEHDWPVLFHPGTAPMAQGSPYVGVGHFRSFYESPGCGPIMLNYASTIPKRSSMRSAGRQRPPRHLLHDVECPARIRRLRSRFGAGRSLRSVRRPNHGRRGRFQHPASLPGGTRGTAPTGAPMKYLPSCSAASLTGSSVSAPDPTSIVRLCDVRIVDVDAVAEAETLLGNLEW
jgi:hypothetical protein